MDGDVTGLRVEPEYWLRGLQRSERDSNFISAGIGLTIMACLRGLFGGATQTKKR